MSGTIDQIVHESETQRQHARFEIPACVQIEGQLHTVTDLSAGGLKIKDIEELYQIGQRVSLLLILKFNDFSITLDLQAQVEHQDTLQNVIGCSFVELSNGQISMLSHIIRSYMTGSVVADSGVFAVMARNSFAGSRKSTSIKEAEKPSIHSLLKRILPTALLVLLGLAALSFTLGNFYERIAVVKSHQALVEGDNITVRSNGQGVFKPLISPETKQVFYGQALAEIKGYALSDTGDVIPLTLVVTSPCDCNIVHRYIRDGEFRAPGEPIFKLTPIRGERWITALLPLKEAQRLNTQNQVNIRIAGQQDFIAGNITYIKANTDDSTMAEIKISSTAPLPEELIGRPAYVEFLLNPLSFKKHEVLLNES